MQKLQGNPLSITPPHLAQPQLKPEETLLQKKPKELQKPPSNEFLGQLCPTARVPALSPWLPLTASLGRIFFQLGFCFL